MSPPLRRDPASCHAPLSATRLGPKLHCADASVCSARKQQDVQVCAALQSSHECSSQSDSVDFCSQSDGVDCCCQSDGVDFCSQSEGVDVCSQSDGVDFVVTLMVEIVCSDGFFREWPQRSHDCSQPV